MSVDYFPTQLYNQLDGALDYFCGAYKAASYNFTVSTQFELISSSQKTNDVAITVFEEPPSFDLKAKHFITHVLVGAVLLVPILNAFVFLGFESEDEDDMPALENIPLDTPDDHSNVILDIDDAPKTVQLPKDIEGNDSPEETTESIKPAPRVTVEASPHMKRLQRRNSKVSQKALAIEQNKLNQQQEMLDAVSPVLDGERSNPVSVAELKKIETSFTETFFRLFPNETCNSEFSYLRKREEDDSSGVLYQDSKYIESLYLNTEGFTPEVRFKNANENLTALITHVEDQYKHLNGNFYLLGNFKNDMQNKIDAIPYIHIIKLLFRASPEEFLKELYNYKFVIIEALEGEKIPVRIDTIEFQKTFKKPGSINHRINNYKNALSQLK